MMRVTCKIPQNLTEHRQVMVAGLISKFVGGLFLFGWFFGLVFLGVFFFLMLLSEPGNTYFLKVAL